MSMQYVDQYGGTHLPVNQVFNMIDNYIYLYHTDTLILLPTFPETISDSMSVEFGATNILSRSAPIYSYSSSGPRTLQISLELHRDMMQQINTSATQFKLRSDNLNRTTDEILQNDYVEVMINQLQSIALPSYAASQKMVDPPIIAVRFGDAVFCKGIVVGGVTVDHHGPILKTNKYAQATVSFTVHEIDPYDAESVSEFGSMRGLNLTLERNIYGRK